MFVYCLFINSCAILLNVFRGFGLADIALCICVNPGNLLLPSRLQNDKLKDVASGNSELGCNTSIKHKITK